MNVFVRVHLNQSVTLQQGQKQPHEEAINLFSFPLFVLDCIILRQRKKKTSSPNLLRISSAWFTQHAGLRSNEILLAGESGLTYFTVTNTPRLQMKQGERKKKKTLLHSIPYKIISILHRAHKVSGEWHFPGPTVKHGLLHMQTHIHRQNACDCLVPLSSFSLSLPLVPFNVLKQVKLF